MIKKFIEKTIGAQVWLIIGPDDLKVFEKRYKITPHNNDTSDGFAYRFYVPKKGGGKTARYYIYLEKKDKYTMVHELAHLVNWIFDYRDIDYSQTNDEIYAYYLEYWFTRFYDAVWGKKK